VPTITLPGYALVTFHTHDLSTYAGWRSFPGDLKLSARSALILAESDDALLHSRAGMLLHVLLHTASTSTISFGCDFSGGANQGPAADDLAGGSFGLVDQPRHPGTGR